MTFKLLCCDGGGIRGLITSLLIQDLDSKYNLIATANGFAGTSTGGLISLGLAHGVGIDHIIKVYENEGSRIFRPNHWLQEEGMNIQGSPSTAAGIMGGPGISSCQYTNDGLNEVAQEMFTEATLASSTKFVAVNSARLWEDGSWQACILANTANNPYREISMVQASLATSAAPTYFPPYCIGKYGFFADGGVFANNPTISAIGEVIAANLANGLQDLRVLSIGTGLTPQGISPSSVTEPLDWGLNYWMWPLASGGVPAAALLNLMMDCSADVAAEQAQLLLDQRVCRANFKLPKPVPLDGWKQTSDLIRYTQTYINSPEWAGVCHWVAQNWSS